MMKKVLIIAGYIFVFWVCLPFVLIVPGYLLDGIRPVRFAPDLILAAAVLLIGTTILGTAMGQLLLQGKGLPISHLPPTRFVASGTYRWVRHPIYIGYTILFAGVVLALKSFWGFMLGIPLLVCAWLLYIRYLEEPVLIKRFGASYEEYRRDTGLFLPRTGRLDRFLRIYYWLIALFIYALWYIFYDWIASETANTSRTLDTGLDRAWPFAPDFEYVYILVYIVPALPLIIIRSAKKLNILIISFTLMSLISFLIFGLYPVYRPRPELEPSSLSEILLAWEYMMDRPVNNFPSLHAGTAMLVYLGCRGRGLTADTLLLLLALGIGASALFVKQHWLADIIAGYLLALAVFTLVSGVSSSARSRNTGFVD